MWRINCVRSMDFLSEPIITLATMRRDSSVMEQIRVYITKSEINHTYIKNEDKSYTIYGTVMFNNYSKYIRPELG